jgi:hypothetical protein
VYAPDTRGLYTRIAKHIRLVGERSSAAPGRFVDESVGVLMAQELWQFEQRAYYPEGPGDERLGLLRVQIDRAEYWIAPGRPSYVFAALKAAVTGVPAGVVGKNQHTR